LQLITAGALVRKDVPLKTAASLEDGVCHDSRRGTKKPKCGSPKDNNKDATTLHDDNVVRSTAGKPHVVGSLGDAESNSTFQHPPSSFQNAKGAFHVLLQGL
jgi:hypothetical protein